LKPSEDGIDNWLVARFWNMSPQPGNYSVSVIGGLQKASAITHIETSFTPKQLTSGELRIDAKPWQLQTFGLLMSLKSAIITPTVMGN